MKQNDTRRSILAYICILPVKNNEIIYLQIGDPV